MEGDVEDELGVRVKERTFFFAMIFFFLKIRSSFSPSCTAERQRSSEVDRLVLGRRGRRRWRGAERQSQRKNFIFFFLSKISFLFC